MSVDDQCWANNCVIWEILPLYNAYILFSYPASISEYLMQIEELIAIDQGDILIMDSKNE